jgi:hypothetical protein
MSKKAITFKTAFVVVIGLHLVGAFAFIQISSMRAKLARLDWKEKLEQRYQNKLQTKIEWPVAKTKVVTKPTPTIAQTSVNTLPKKATVVEKKKEINTVSQKPKNTSTTETIYYSSTEYKNGQKTQRSINVYNLSELVDRKIKITSSRPSADTIQIIPVY